MSDAEAPNKPSLEELEYLSTKPIRTMDELIILAYAVPELITRIRELELGIQYIFREFVNEPADCEFASPNCPHNIGKYWCGADNDEKVDCYIRQAVKAAKEAGNNVHAQGT